MFFANIIGVFVLLPVVIYLILRWLLPHQLRRWVVNILGILGIGFAIWMISWPFIDQPSQPGELVVILLIPIGGLFGITVALLLWRNNRSG